MTTNENEPEPVPDKTPDHGTPETHPGGNKSMIGGYLASAYCIIAGLMGITGFSANFFTSLQASYVAVAFGVTTLILLIIVSRNYSSMLALMGKNFAIVFGLALIILFFTQGGQPTMQQTFRLVLQLAVAWIVFSTFSQLQRSAKASGNDTFSR